MCYSYFYARPKFSCAGWHLTRGVYILFELGNNLLPPSHKCLPQFINDNFPRNWKFSILYVFLLYFLLSFPFMAFFTFSLNFSSLLKKSLIYLFTALTGLFFKSSQMDSTTRYIPPTSPRVGAWWRGWEAIKYMPYAPVFDLNRAASLIILTYVL